MLKVNLGVEGGQSVQEHAEGRSRSVGAGVDVVGPDVMTECDLCDSSGRSFTHAGNVMTGTACLPSLRDPPALLSSTVTQSGLLTTACSYELSACEPSYVSLI